MLWEIIITIFMALLVTGLFVFIFIFVQNKIKTVDENQTRLLQDVKSEVDFQNRQLQVQKAAIKDGQISDMLTDQIVGNLTKKQADTLSGNVPFDKLAFANYASIQPDGPHGLSIDGMTTFDDMTLRGKLCFGNVCVSQEELSSINEFKHTVNDIKTNYNTTLSNLFVSTSKTNLDINMNAMNTSNLALQFASNIASFQSTLGKNTSDIAFNASNISTNMSSIANMQISLGTNTSNISDIYKTIGTYSTQTSNLARSFTDSIASQNNRLDDFNRTMGYYEVNTSNLSSKLTDNVATQNTKFDNMVSNFNTSNANMQYTINSNYNLLNNIISTYDMKTSNLLSSNMTFKDQIASLQQQDQAILNLQNQYNTVITEDTWQSKILASLQQQDKIITAEDIWQNQMLSALQSQGTSNIVANDLQNKQLTSLQDQGTSNISVNNLQNRQLSSLLPPVTYPPSALTSYSTVIGGNTYVAAASTERTNTLRSWKAFDNKVSSDPYMGWQTKDGCYNGTTWVATTNPAFDGFTPGDYSGEWISLTLPFPIYLKGYTIQGDAVDWRIYASLTPNVTSSWTVVHTGARTNPTYAQSNTYTLNLTGPYIKFVMKIKRSKMAAGFGRGCMKSIAYKGNPA
jgi:hypothetical protein